MKKLILIFLLAIANLTVLLFSEQIRKSQQGFWSTPIIVLLIILICSPTLVFLYLHRRNLIVKNIFWENTGNIIFSLSALIVCATICLGIFSNPDTILVFETNLGAGYATVVFLIILFFAIWSKNEFIRKEKLYVEIEDILKAIQSDHTPNSAGMYTLYEKTQTIGELRKHMRNETSYGKTIVANFWRDTFMSSPVGTIIELTG